MGRPKQQEGGKGISITVYESQLKMADALIKGGYFKNTSEMIRYGIEKVFEEKISNTEDLIEFKKVELEKLIKSLETIQKNSQNKLDNIVKEYEERRKYLTPRGIARYEEVSKEWIEFKMDILSKLFPNKTVDEIYEELEKRIKKG